VEQVKCSSAKMFRRQFDIKQVKANEDKVEMFELQSQNAHGQTRHLCDSIVLCTSMECQFAFSNKSNLKTLRKFP